jgi:putative methionine-R-sulfoxide reductase with GAF domain
MHPQESRPADADAAYSVFGRERRRSPRHRVQTPAYASLSGSSQAAALELCEILDISDSGMCIQGPSPLDVNRLLPLVLDLSKTSALIHTIGFVVWSEESGKTGIRFPEMPEASKSDLDHWIVVNAAASVHGVDNAVSTLTAQHKPKTEIRQTSLEQAPSENDCTDLEKEIDVFGSDLESVLHLIAQRTLFLTRATGVAIALMDMEKETLNVLNRSVLICRAFAGAGTPELGARLQAGSGFSGECVRSASTLKCDDAETDPRVDRESCRALKIGSLIAAAVKAETGEVIGILEVFSPDTEAFSDKDCAVLENLADIIADAVLSSEDDASADLPVNPFAGDSDNGLSAARQVSARNHDISVRSPSVAPKSRMLLSGIAAIAFTVWLVEPTVAAWFKHSSKNPTPSSAQQSTQAVPPQNLYAGTSAKDLQQLALGGDAAAQYALGLRYASGDGIKQNYREALGWFLKSADQGDARAASKLAAYFWSGRGSPRDDSKAYFWGLLAQAAGDQQGRLIVLSSASHLSAAQIASEQQQADKWLHEHHILPVPAAAQ